MKKVWRFPADMREDLLRLLWTFNILGPREQAPLDQGGYTYHRRTQALSPQADDLKKREQEHGRGFYEERRDLLNVALNRLEGRPNCSPGDVCWALWYARFWWETEVMFSYYLQVQRQFYEERDLLLKHVPYWLKRLKRLLEEHRQTIDEDMSIQSQVVPHIDKIFEALASDPTWSLPEIEPRRRAKSKQVQPWLAKAHKVFTEAGIPKNLHSNLLRAIGIIPYRPA